MKSHLSSLSAPQLESSLASDTVTSNPKEMPGMPPLLPTELLQEIGKGLDAKSLVSLHKVNKHIHLSLISQVVNKQIENVGNLKSFENAVGRIKKCLFLRLASATAP